MQQSFFLPVRSFILILFLIYTVACSHYNPIENNPVHKEIIIATQRENIDRNQYESQSRHYMITSQGVASSKAAELMFALGGNVFDAAAALSFAISVERPHSTGIGGGGFMLIHLAKSNQTLALDFREKAPALAREKMFLDSQGNVIENMSLDTPLSSGVPGLVAGVLDMHAKYGKLNLRQVIEPAAQLAENGFLIYPDLAEAIEKRKNILFIHPDSRKIFFHSSGIPLNEGDRLIQKDLANTLRKIAKNGKDIFYKGEIADAIVSSQKNNNGLISKKDLQDYSMITRKPVWGEFKNYKIASMPPPSSGGIHVIQILNILEGYDLEKIGFLTPTSIHYTAAATQQAFADRATYLGDSDFVNVPMNALTSEEYAFSIRKQIHPTLSTPSKDIRAGNVWPFQNPKESSQTTHFTIMDIEGNIVSSTQTINTYFGSGLVVEGTGILLNNQMDDFSAKPGALNAFGAVGSKNNSIAPGKRPLSSMSPTIVFDTSGALLALGTPSGTRIISCVAQTILNYLEYKMPLFDAVAVIRFHHQWSPDEIQVDPPGFSPLLSEKVRAMGYSVGTKSLGCQVNAIAKEGSILKGVSDPRGEGMSIGK